MNNIIEIYPASKVIYKIESHFLGSLKKYFLRIFFKNGNIYNYNIFTAKDLSLITLKFQFGKISIDEIYNNEIKVKYRKIEDLWTFLTSSIEFQKLLQKEVIFQELSQLENRKQELLLKLSKLNI